MHITNLENTVSVTPKMEGAEGVIKQVPISSAEGSPSFSFRVFTVKPGGHTPLHAHLFEHLNYIISGSGTLVEGLTEHVVKEGDFALVMPGEVHQYRNNSTDRDLIFICAVPQAYE
jgi:quercetin dioxygenase-like cupin family protein